MNVIFDCDGVIFDSNELKTTAFEIVLRDFPQEEISKFIEYHRTNGGISRYEKFRYFLDEMTETNYKNYSLENLLKSFSLQCQKLYLTCPFTYQADMVIKRLASKHQLFVASGSDEVELNSVFKSRGISSYFVKILGSPKKKEHCIADIISGSDCSSGTIMIGDAVKDYEASLANGLPCILMPTYSDAKSQVEEIANENNCLTIANLSELETILVEGLVL